MAYNLHYYYSFTNYQNDSFRVEILELNYTGDITQLQATDKPFVIAPLSGDNDIYSPIKPTAASLSFWSKNNGDERDGIPAYSVTINDFYSNTQNAFRVDFYDNNDNLLWSGFIQIDNSDDELQDYAVPINLDANDNLGLLQNINFLLATVYIPSTNIRYTQSGVNIQTTASEDDPIGHNNLFQVSGVPSNPGIQPGDQLLFFGTYYTVETANYLPFSMFLTIVVVQHISTSSYTGASFTVYESIATSPYTFAKLTDILAAIMQSTSLQLECDAFLNIFENNTDDRSVNPTNDFLQQTVIHTNYFLDSEGNFTDCYTILTNICHDFSMTLTQANGRWVIFREGEFRLFTNGDVPGTRYDANFNVLSSTVSHSLSIIGRNNDFGPQLYYFEPINANQQRRILKPFQYSKRKLTYALPDWIDDYRFTNVFNLTGSDTTLGIVSNFYTIPSNWYDPNADVTNPNGITSLVVAFDSTLGNTEIDRYMLISQWSPQGTKKWMQFNAIPVVKKSVFSFNFNFFAAYYSFLSPVPPPSHGTFNFRARFQLLTSTGDIYFLEQVTVSTNKYLQWSSAQPAANWNTDDGLLQLADENYGNINNYSVSVFDDNGVIPPFPEDGLFLIGLAGNNGDTIFYPAGVKNLDLSVKNNLGVISSMTAQVHKQSQDNPVKNNSEEDINFDDTLVNTIKGTLLINVATNFGIWVGDFYNTRTQFWHRANLTESLRLQQINTFDTLFIQRIARTIVEGDFFGLRYRPAGTITGNGTIEIDPPEIEVNGRPNADGIYPGMYISFAGYTYRIVSVSSVPGTVQIITDPSPVGSAFPDVDYIIQWPLTYISMFNLFNIAFMPGKVFIPGIASFDFKTAIWSMTMYELYDEGEVDGDLTAEYQFSYLYNTK